MNIGHRFVCSLLCVCLGGEDMDWEDFPSRGELLERLKIHLPLQKESEHWMQEEKQMEVRMRYGVKMPSWKTRNRILEDFP